MICIVSGFVINSMIMGKIIISANYCFFLKIGKVLILEEILNVFR